MLSLFTNRNVQSLVEQGQKGELTMQPGKSMMESLESSINKVNSFDLCDSLLSCRDGSEVAHPFFALIQTVFTSGNTLKYFREKE